MQIISREQSKWFIKGNRDTVDPFQVEKTQRGGRDPRFKMYHIHIPTTHSECNHYELKTCTNKRIH